MLLKDCPVGSVVRLVSVGGSNEIPHCWRDLVAVVQEDDEGNFVIDGDKDKRHCKNNFHHFEIVHPAPTPEPRITFTVGDQEFHVGQRVWAIEANDEDHIKIGDEFIVSGVAHAYSEFRLAIRRPKSASHIFALSKGISITPPTPHEWRRGDWARHEEFGECFVCSGVDFAGEVRVDFVGCSASVRYETLTFIKHIDLPS